MQRDTKAAKAFRYVVAIAAYIVLTTAALSTYGPFVGALQEETIEITGTVQPPTSLAALGPAIIDDADFIDPPADLEQPAILDRSIEPERPAEQPEPAPQPRVTLNPAQTIVGIASFYDFPQETASGERYNRNAFTAAAQLKIRDRFGGIKFGRLYRPAYGLAEWEGKKVILRFNDVGPLRPGRTVDLSRAAMLHFAELNKGLLHDFKVTPLPIGEIWPEGPVTDPQLAALGIAFGVATAAHAPQPQPVATVPAARRPHPLDDFAFSTRPLASVGDSALAPFGAVAFWSESAAQVTAAIAQPWNDQLIVTGSVPAKSQIVAGIDYWD